MGGRAVEGSGLENRQPARARGFESHPIRHFLTNRADIVENILLWSNHIHSRVGYPCFGPSEAAVSSWR
jgi:hypothetical protein